MSNKVSVQALLPLIREQLEQGGQVTLTVTGNSMYPLLTSGRDRVTIAPMTRPLRVNDVVFYLRVGEIPILHRVVRLAPDGSFVCCGDSQLQPEPGLRPEQVLGIAVAFERAGRQISAASLRYRAASTLWRRLRPLREPLLALLRRRSGKGEKNAKRIGGRIK